MTVLHIISSAGSVRANWVLRLNEPVNRSTLEQAIQTRLYIFEDLVTVNATYSGPCIP